MKPERLLEMSKSLVDLLTEKQDAERRELETLTSLAVEDFTEEKEARASALAGSIKDRDSKIANARDEEARAATSAEAARKAGEVEKEEQSRGPVQVTAEERTYTLEKNRRGMTSFFGDAYNAQVNSDFNARERLIRHSREVQIEGEGVSQRATTTSSFASLIVPQYLVEQAALIARAGRPFANTVTHLPLPDQGMSFFIPKGTTGAATAIQATQNTSVQNTDQVWADVQVNVQTIAGQQDISRQSLERGTPGIDTLVYLDLAGSYAVNVDSQAITGTGTGTKGLQNSGGTQATAFGAAATPGTFYTKLAGAVNSVQTLRFMAPDAICMHPRRWNWLVGQVDSSLRPLVVPGYAGPTNALAGYGNHPSDTPLSTPVGYLQGLPVYTDANVPTSVGSGPEDQVYVYRTQDFYLWEEGDGLPRQLRFEETLGNQLTVKLVVYGYIALTGERYPLSSAIIGGNATVGNGLVAPTF
jgi:HK97 family phage major capsid protein